MLTNSSCYPSSWDTRGRVKLEYDKGVPHTESALAALLQKLGVVFTRPEYIGLYDKDERERSTGRVGFRSPLRPLGHAGSLWHVFDARRRRSAVARLLDSHALSEISRLIDIGTLQD